MDLLEKSETASRHPWELARLEVVKYLLYKEISDFKGKKILDLGCGDLFFITEFAKDKPQSHFYAVDIAFSEEFIKAESKESLILSNSLDEIAERKNIVFDIIFLMDVVEHIEHDVGFLKNLIEGPHVSKETLLVITVPAFQELFSKHDVFLGHFRRYTNSSIENVVRSAGMKAVKKGYFFSSLLLPRILEKLMENKDFNNKNEGTGLTSWDKNIFITKSIKIVLLIDFQITYYLSQVGLKLPGLSNYILCKKRV